MDKRFRQLIVPFFKIKKAMKTASMTQMGGENQILHFLARPNHEHGHHHIAPHHCSGHHHVMLDGDKIMPSDIARSCHMTSARVASALKILEKKGFVERVNSKTDRRKVYVSITKAGMKEMKSRLGQLGERINHIFDKLTKQEADEFINILNKIADIATKDIKEIK
ncbi:MAG: MarR family transcriptional regulator [Mycoplasmataceae bacterium]|jgi:DNA-binding MarR family transcriptional regulator|nr:MarR family transcriptional regulator [Mycoplasmataceae bacterium]